MGEDFMINVDNKIDLVFTYMNDELVPQNLFVRLYIECNLDNFIKLISIR